jgi:hypothetical protein
LGWFDALIIQIMSGLLFRSCAAAGMRDNACYWVGLMHLSFKSCQACFVGHALPQACVTMLAIGLDCFSYHSNHVRLAAQSLTYRKLSFHCYLQTCRWLGL